jgi:hypothetical protein
VGVYVLALVIRQTNYIYSARLDVILCGLSGVTIFFYMTSQKDWFSEKKIENKMRVLIIFTTFIWSTSHSKKNLARYYRKCTYIGLHVKYRYSCHISITLELSRHIFEESSNIQFYETSSSGSWLVECGCTDRKKNRQKETKADRQPSDLRN